MNSKKRKSCSIEEFQTFIKEQTETIISTIKDQHAYDSEIQQRQHDEQMDIFKKFLEKF